MQAGGSWEGGHRIVCFAHAQRQVQEPRFARFSRFTLPPHLAQLRKLERLQHAEAGDVIVQLRQDKCGQVVEKVWMSSRGCDCPTVRVDG